MTAQEIDPRWGRHVEASARMNDALSRMGDLIPPLDTPEQVAATRVVPDAFRAQELPLTMQTRTIPGPGGEIPARVAVPPTVRGVYLDIHGGGFCLGWPESKDLANAQLALAAEVAVVSIDYRLAPEHPFPAGPNDCKAAADWLVDHALAEFGSERLLVGGDSAGANLSALVALHMREAGTLDRVAGLGLLYGVYDLSGTPSSRNRPKDALVLSLRATHKFHDLYLPGLSVEELRDPGISPLYADLTALPPALFCVGALDPLLDDTLFMAARWEAAGNVAETYVVPESPHGFAAFPTPMAAEFEALHAEWIRARLAG
jgi:acetyl esterase/lipase